MSGREGGLLADRELCATCRHGPVERCDQNRLGLATGWRRVGSRQWLLGERGWGWYECPRYISMDRAKT